MAGTVAITGKWIASTLYKVTFTCVGDSVDGSIPNTTINVADYESIYRVIQGMYFYYASGYPTPGGTAPDAADVFILDQYSEDLLGSDDNSTAANGANLIHATLKRSTLPYSGLINVNFYHVIDSEITLQVASQATASAQYIIELTFTS